MSDQTSVSNETGPRRSRNPLRWLYDWMLAWAEKPSGPIALGAISFAESSFFPIPPDPLLLALSLGKPRRALYFAAICTAGSVLGGMAGYAIGWFVWAQVSEFFFTHVPGVSPEAFTSVQEMYIAWGFWAVFIAGFTPLPYKVFTLSAGVFQVPFPIFVLASAISRSARFFIIAGLVYFFGEPMQIFIDRHFDRLAWAFGILLIMGFAAIRFL
jgi:membrane protein YqaA with SNARE-associated domain